MVSKPKTHRPRSKAAFVNDMCDYWKVVTTEIANNTESKEENIFEDINKLFGGSKG